MRDRFIATLQQLAAADPRIVLITGDLGFGVLDAFRAELGDQFINAGVAEQNMTMVATGLALEGHVAVTYSIGNFPTLRALEMIRNDAAYHDADVKVVCIGGGFSYGALGPSHHATEDISILRALPNLSVLVPSGLYEVEMATRALVEQPGTCYLRLDKSVGDDMPGTPPFRFGRARVLRESGHLHFITAGGILDEVWKATRLLEDSGWRAGVVTLPTLKPIDRQTICSLASCGPIVTVEEHTVDGGVGSAVAEVLVDEGLLGTRVLRLGLRAGFSSAVGSQSYLRREYGLDASSIAAATLEFLG